MMLAFAKISLLLPLALTMASAATSSPSSCDNTITTDVAIVGAGMSGIAAARRFLMEGLTDFVLLESADEIGGRTKKLEVGAEGAMTVPWGECANVVYWTDYYNPVWDVAYNQLGLSMEYVEYYYSVFDENGTQLEYEDLYGPWDRLYTEGLYKIGDMRELEFNPEQRLSLPPDEGSKKALEDLGWTIDGGQDVGESPNLRKAIYWDGVDWGILFDSQARLGRGPYNPNPTHYSYIINDDRGFESVPRKFWADVMDLAASGNVFMDRELLYLNTRVQTIHYDEPGDYSALLEATDSNGACMNVRAKRVISTLPSAAIEKNLVEFSPPLPYDIPYRTGQFHKVFFQFENTFWDNTTSFHMMFPEDPDGNNECIMWRNVNSLHGGSNMLLCFLVTGEFEALRDATTQLLTDDTMLKLLDPFRRAYGSDVVGTPIYMYQDTIHLDVNKGYGAYADFKIGASPLDFAQFFGGIDDVTGHHGPGAHNGLNSKDEHILHMGGADSCWDWRTTVTGAFYAGERSSINVMRSLGMNKNFSEYYKCEEKFEPLRGSIDKPKEPEKPVEVEEPAPGSDDDDDDDDESLSHGAIIGLAIGGALAMILMCVVLFRQHSASAAAGVGKPDMTIDQSDEEEASS